MSKTPPQPVQPSGPPPAPPSEAENSSATYVQGSADGPPEIRGLPISEAGVVRTTTPQRIGDFTVVRVLGQGGMGTVYLAEDVRLGRKAAIKTMKRELAENTENRVRFNREARAAAAVEHDNIVPVWQIGEAADGSPFIAMPFLQGEMLETRLRREPIQPLGMILKIARDVAEGLAAAHARGLIHRDIKPGNVWIEGDPESKDLNQQVRRCKILDFGLARSVGTEDAQLTASGTILGTPSYMAPEQASSGTVDHRADLFSLGVMLYRMSTGRMPFAGPNVMVVLAALANVNPPSARTLCKNLPQAVSDLIARLMSKDPTGRPGSAAEVVAAVRQIIKDLQAKKSAVVQAAPVKTPDLPKQPRTSDESKTVPLPPERAPRPRTKAGRRRTALLVSLGLLALVPLVWWLATVILRVETPNGTLIVQIDDPDVEARIKNGKLILTGPDDKVRYTLSPSERDKKIDAGPYKIRVEGADGLILDTPEFTLKKGDKVTVRVTAAGPVVAKNGDPDRTAAEWVLSIGGTVQVNRQDQEIKAAANLPREAFRLTTVDLHDNKQVTDAGLVNFKECKNLDRLIMNATQVTDTGLIHLRNCKNLTTLDLGNTKVSDAGLDNFTVDKHLWFLALYGTQVTDAGLARFADCKNVAHLDLRNIKMTDAGLANFKGCNNLLGLDLSGTLLTDRGLVHFAGCKKLDVLDLRDTSVGDAGLAHFKDCKDMTFLTLQKTKVTAKGIDELKTALPKCKIEWDGGVIEPRVGVDPDRTAAEWVLSIGGAVSVNGGEAQDEIRTADKLPQEAFRLTGLRFVGTPKVTDAALAVFKDCKHLAHLYLAEAAVTPAGLAAFKDSKTLTALVLSGAMVTDAGMAQFKGCTNLTYLQLGSTQLTDVGLANFADCKKLTQLVLRVTQVTDAGLAVFKDCENLSILQLDLAKFTDAGVAHFKDCRKLQMLGLSGTEITDAGLAHFKLRNLSFLNVSNTAVTDAGLAYFKDRKSLTYVDVSGTKVTDACAAHLTGLDRLTYLNLTNTNMTAKGAEGLAKALPKCKIEWAGGVIEPRP